jgi:putative transcriptional regulator
VALALHRGQAIATAREIGEGMALLADMDALRDLLQRAPAADASVRVFSGYAGWGSGQLQSEMDESSWIVSPAHPELVFARDSAGVWAEALKRLGPRYEFLATMPEDPRVN